MKTEIMKLLKETDGYVSGQEICSRLQVSRTAVWKVMNQLRGEGYQIEAVPNRGYRLLGAPDVMTEAELKSSLGDTGFMGSRVEYYEEIDSTNTQAKRLAEEGAQEGTLVAAGMQAAGKGRRGRVWTSPPGKAVFMSLILRPPLSPEQASMLTLAAALGTAAGIRDVCGVEPQIKWPNDLVLNGRKICGILTEMSTELCEIQYVVLGIGINVNNESFAEDISDKATSLMLETGKSWKRCQIAAAVVRRLEEYYTCFLQTGDLSVLQKEYELHLANLDRQVVVLAPGGEYGGICRGINIRGELLVERGDHTVERVLSGEVSVRGIYGYV